jgi:exopolyphosphatase/guanosine-5'-triphosphate,3'-diphosphate pyrophosphatase
MDRELHAAIDVGSHSVKLTIARRDDAGRWLPVVESVRVTGLGAGDPARDGLAPDGCTRTIAALTEFLAICHEQDVARVSAVGTAVFRRAIDAREFVARIRDTLGLTIEVISGEKEAALTYRGALESLAPIPTDDLDVACDIGGHSTELGWGRGPVPADLRSLDLGTISLARAHGLDSVASDERVAAARAAVGDRLADLSVARPVARLVAIGATPGSLIALAHGEDIADGSAVHGRPLPRDLVDEQIDRLGPLTTAERRELAGLHPDRAPVILAGAVIVGAIQDRWPEAPTVVSSAGLREGVLAARTGANP